MSENFAQLGEDNAAPFRLCNASSRTPEPETLEFAPGYGFGYFASV
jgi:hypothetical protein